MTIGLRLKEERERIGLSQAAMGKLGGTTKKTQIDYETDRTPPKATYLSAIAAAGVDVGYLITGIRKGTEHTTPAAQLLRMKVLASLLADELHKRGMSLGEVSFHETLDMLWPDWSTQAPPDPQHLRERINQVLPKGK